MNDTSSSEPSSSSSQPAGHSSQHTTPKQSPENSPTSIYPPTTVDTPGSDVSWQQIVDMLQNKRESVNQAIAREEQKLFEYQDREEAAQRALAETRREVAEERARADRNEVESEVAKAENTRLAEQLRDVKHQHEAVANERNAIAGQLDDKARQLAEAEDERLGSEIALRSTFQYLARIENDKTALQQQLDETQNQLVGIEGDLAESTQRSGRYYAELSDLQVQFNEEQSRRRAAEEQLDGQAEELDQVRSQFDDERNKVLKLQSELERARAELVAMEALRSESDDLAENNRILTTEAAELRNRNSRLEREIHDLEEQRQIAAVEVDSVRTALGNEQARAVQLQGTTTTLQRAQGLLTNEVQQLRIKCEGLEGVNASLLHTSSSTERDNNNLRTQCAALDTQAAVLQTTIDRNDSVRARIPRRPGMIRYNGGSRQLAMCQRGPVTIHQAYPVSRPMLRTPVTA